MGTNTDISCKLYYSENTREFIFTDNTPFPRCPPPEIVEEKFPGIIDILKDIKNMIKKRN